MKIIRVDFNYAVQVPGAGGARMSLGAADLHGSNPDSPKSLTVTKLDGATGILADLGHAAELGFIPMANVRAIRVEREKPAKAPVGK